MRNVEIVRALALVAAVVFAAPAATVYAQEGLTEAEVQGQLARPGPSAGGTTQVNRVGEANPGTMDQGPLIPFGTYPDDLGIDNFNPFGGVGGGAGGGGEIQPEMTDGPGVEMN